MPTNSIILPKKEIESLKPNTNYVLVKIDDPNEYRVTESGIFLYNDSALPTKEHANRCGLVVSICDKLTFSTKTCIITRDGSDLTTPATDSLDNDTDLEVEIGDKVWFSYIHGLNCTEFATEELEEDKYGRKYRINYKLIKYDQLRLRQRGEEYRTLNGNVLVRLDKIKASSVLEVEEKYDIRYGEVVYSGTPNRRYKSPNLSDCEVSIGDKVVMTVKTNMDREFEYSLHGKLEKGLRIVRGCDIFGLVQQTSKAD